ncbi:MAG: hypothetical protein K940chlam1_00364 [Candidatus Anoxychlamydiales bacterium]|nr:hypothetical protein [Candidatus Anoxychlamydiales bacterium]NGX36055.1 hypothetical protein [Candidatus Anoxychlamydiales bacterium]
MRKLCVIFLLFFVFLSYSGYSNNNSKPVSVYVFWGKGCYHCEKEKVFLKKIQKKHSNLKVQYLEVWDNKQNQKLLERVGKEMGFNVSGLPITIIGKRYFIGFSDENTTGVSIEKAIQIEQKRPSFDVVKDLKNSKEKKSLQSTKKANK